MTDKHTDEQVTEKVLSLVSVCYRTFSDALFERLDQLHRQDIHDTQVIRALRKIGEVDFAAEYIDWSGAIDPDAEPNETLGGTVPDPAGAESYKEHPLNQPGIPIRVTGKAHIGYAIEFGRDELGGQWVRPEGGIWTGVVENL
jgi:hypothetical protein